MSVNTARGDFRNPVAPTVVASSPLLLVAGDAGCHVFSSNLSIPLETIHLGDRPAITLGLETIKWGHGVSRFCALVIAADVAAMPAWIDLIRSARSAIRSLYIICMLKSAHVSQDHSNDAILRMNVASAGACMISYDISAILAVLYQAFSLVRGPYACVYCNLELAEDSLCHHNALAHVNEKNITRECPICFKVCSPRHDPYPVHLRNAHGPCGRREIVSEYDHDDDKLYAFSLVVCLRDHDGKQQMLLVQEFASSGWWLPGGRVDPGENLNKAAIRECKEEAGCDVELTGVLKLQYTPTNHGSVRLRVTFAARMRDSQQRPKSVPDYESMGATWVDFDLIEELASKRMLRGSEPLIWARYIKSNGVVYPMSLLEDES